MLDLELPIRSLAAIMTLKQVYVLLLASHASLETVWFV